MKISYRLGKFVFLIFYLLSAVSWGSPSCLALWEVSTSVDSASNLLVNGSFEVGPDPGTYLPLNPGSTVITGWTVTRGQVDYVGIWQSFDGSRSIDLDGTPGFGGIAQTFATHAGVTYAVNFAMAGNPHGSPEPKVMAVEAAGQSTSFIFDATGTTYVNMAWEKKNWKFVATGTTTTLEFYSLDNIDGFYGPALDSVSVNPVPVAIDPTVLALWHFDEGSGSTLHDASIYHNDGTIHNTTWVPGIVGDALHFDGLTSHVDVPNSASLQPARNFVIDSWFNLDTLQFDSVPLPDYGHGVILGNLGPYPAGGGYQLHIRTGAQFQFAYRVGNPISEFTGFTPIPLAHHYYHIETFYLRRLLGVDSMTVVKTYLDGVLTDSVAFTDQIQYSNTPTFYIGTNIDGRAVGGPGVRDFPGIIDEITIRSLESDGLPPPPPPPLGSVTGWVNEASGTTEWLLGTLFQNAMTGWVCGMDGTLLKTSNGGHSWIPQSSGVSQPLWSIDFVDANNGWIVGDQGTVIHTTNGGSTWVEQSTTGTTLRLECVDFVDPNTGWIAGGQTGPGTILKTTDGGVTWATQYSSPGAWLLFVRFFDANTGYVSGADGRLMKTTDGGANWTILTSGTTNWILALHLFDANTVTAVGWNGTIIKTTNGGTSWIPALSGAGGAFYESVDFTDQNHGYAVSNDNAIVRTVDGGIHWTAMTNPSNEGLYYVHFADATHGWAVGFNGAIISTDTTTSGLPGGPAGPAYRTFSQLDYAARAHPLRGSTAPTAANVRDETFIEMGWFSNGLFVGIPRRDSTLYYGYFYFRKSLERLNRFLPHSGPPRGFDTYIGNKPWHFSRANPAVKYHDNHLAGEQYILKFNVGASDVGITPTGFGDLIYGDSAQPANPFNGMTIREIMAHTDTALTFFRRFTPAYYAKLDSCLSRINSAFLGPITIYTTSPLHVAAAVSLSQVSYLHPNPEALPVVRPVDDAGLDEQTPTTYALYQNYPNPFNPVTSIDFDLVAPSNVTLRVYNTLGQIVGDLLHGAALDEGRQTVEFDASALPSGVYFYRLELTSQESSALRHTMVRKMMLMK